MSKKLKLAIVGTQGLPNKYGGFETLVEYLVKYISDQFEITVFCSSKIYPEKTPQIDGCKLRYIPLHANGMQSIPYDMISILKSVKKYDRILILGSSGGFILPLLKRYSEKFILNFGGLDWKRSKWNTFAKKFLKISEALAVKNSNVVISDNIGIQQYIKEEYQRESILIEYGGDQVSNEAIDDSDIDRYPFLKKPFALSVARIQHDNNIEMILEAFQQETSMPIVFVGNWDSSSYGKEVKQKFSNCSNIVILDAIYDQRQLNKIRSNCTVYVHGHSAGGTNPSLVEAMNLKLPVFAYSSGFNENTTENKAIYFKNKEQLIELFKPIDESKMLTIASDLKEIADRRYKWSIIADKYAACLK